MYSGSSYQIISAPKSTTGYFRDLFHDFLNVFIHLCDLTIPITFSFNAKVHSISTSFVLSFTLLSIFLRFSKRTLTLCSYRTFYSSYFCCKFLSSCWTLRILTFEDGSFCYSLAKEMELSLFCSYLNLFSIKYYKSSYLHTLNHWNPNGLIKIKWFCAML